MSASPRGMCWGGGVWLGTPPPLLLPGPSWADHFGGVNPLGTEGAEAETLAVSLKHLEGEGEGGGGYPPPLRCTAGLIHPLPPPLQRNGGQLHACPGGAQPSPRHTPALPPPGPSTRGGGATTTGPDATPPQLSFKTWGGGCWGGGGVVPVGGREGVWLGMGWGGLGLGLGSPSWWNQSWFYNPL